MHDFYQQERRSYWFWILRMDFCPFWLLALMFLTFGDVRVLPWPHRLELLWIWREGLHIRVQERGRWDELLMDPFSRGGTSCHSPIFVGHIRLLVLYSHSRVLWKPEGVSIVVWIMSCKILPCFVLFGVYLLLPVFLKVMERTAPKRITRKPHLNLLDTRQLVSGGWGGVGVWETRKAYWGGAEATFDQKSL